MGNGLKDSLICEPIVYRDHSMQWNRKVKLFLIACFVIRYQLFTVTAIISGCKMERGEMVSSATVKHCTRL